MQQLKNQKAWKTKKNVFSWRLKVLTESTRRSGDGRLFQARGAATANERSPSDGMVRGTATEPDVADLRPALAVVAILSCNVRNASTKMSVPIAT